MAEQDQLLEEFIASITHPVIVEGRKDAAALQSLGVEDVVQLNHGGSLLSTVEALQDNDRVVILTDLDQQGKILRKKLIRYMSLYGIQEDKKPRELLARLRMSHVEGLGRINQR